MEIKSGTGIIASLFIGIILILLAPEDKVLGSILKLIYLHGALVNSSLFLFTALGIVSLTILLRKSHISFFFALEKTAIIYWIAATIIGNWTSHLAWGGIFWSEPRLKFMILISVMSTGIYFISTALENYKIASFLGVILSISIWILFTGTGKIMHPDDPFSVSESPFRSFFILITFFFLLASIFSVRWIAGKN